ncbi:hypothetical protein DF220_10560 [Salinibacterium hongtaonis]|uniref:RiboL-PSP-HEPN domain-containing protein n=1 Tax=Homoserinimonas hongtaonis TaxID=2079791 RepID=A0A2U1T301_9MICO|nr:hypothetical protein DF220_10560 [Salinibacterium hongtaonis]
MLTLERVAEIARATIFNTPKPSQVDELFERAIGIPALSSGWTTPPEMGDALIQNVLLECIQLRGLIAHGASPRPVISKSKVSEFIQTIQSLVEQTDNAVGAFLHERTGSNPWNNKPATVDGSVEADDDDADGGSDA